MADGDLTLEGCAIIGFVAVVLLCIVAYWPF